MKSPHQCCDPWKLNLMKTCLVSWKHKNLIHLAAILQRKITLIKLLYIYVPYQPASGIVFPASSKHPLVVLATFSAFFPDSLTWTGWETVLARLDLKSKTIKLSYTTIWTIHVPIRTLVLLKPQQMKITLQKFMNSKAKGALFIWVPHPMSDLFVLQFSHRNRFIDFKQDAFLGRTTCLNSQTRFDDFRQFRPKC